MQEIVIGLQLQTQTNQFPLNDSRNARMLGCIGESPVEQAMLLGLQTLRWFRHESNTVPEPIALIVGNLKPL